MATTPRSDWKPPPPRRLRTILERLRREYGRPIGQPHRAPVDELVLTVLSQNTNDRNRDVAYDRLRERFESWQAGPRRAARRRSSRPSAPAGWRRHEGAADPAPSSARTGRTTTSMWLERRAARGRRATTSARCPGVGRKTAACVLLFAFGRPDMPVDTHVHRVGTRLGLFRPGAPLEECHDEMLRLSARRTTRIESHMALIRHGRRICHARMPDCGECPLRRTCPAYRDMFSPTASRRKGGAR